MNSAKPSLFTAVSLLKTYSYISDMLRSRYPCAACDGTGDRHGKRRRHYPEPCVECWGRGFDIPEEDDE